MREFKRRKYKGWMIEGKGRDGMYTATHPDLWSVLKADTLLGMQGLITRTSSKGN